MENTSIIIPDPKPCAFCDYLNNKRPFTFVYKDKNIAVLVTREQRGKPHLLVIPLKHVETLLELSNKEATQLIIAVKKVANAIEQEYKPAGISIWQNNGVSSNQTIAHVHFHIAGTHDANGTTWGHVPELSLDETEKIALRLRSYFKI